MYQTGPMMTHATNANSAAYVGPNIAEESGSPIRDGIGLAEQSLSAIHEAISFLENRLDTVLSPVPPSPANVAAVGKLPPPVTSHVHGRLVILNDGFAEAVRRVHGLMGRIEV